MLHDFRERPTLEFVDGETCFHSFLYGNRTAVKGSQEKIQEPLPGRSVVENISDQRRPRRLVYKGRQTVGR